MIIPDKNIQIFKKTLLIRSERIVKMTDMLLQNNHFRLNSSILPLNNTQMPGKQKWFIVIVTHE